MRCLPADTTTPISKWNTTPDVDFSKPKKTAFIVPICAGHPTELVVTTKSGVYSITERNGKFSLSKAGTNQPEEMSGKERKAILAALDEVEPSYEGFDKTQMAKIEAFGEALDISVNGLAYDKVSAKNIEVVSDSTVTATIDGHRITVEIKPEAPTRIKPVLATLKNGATTPIEIADQQKLTAALRKIDQLPARVVPDLSPTERQHLGRFLSRMTLNLPIAVYRPS
jgi:hypothetical protein